MMFSRPKISVVDRGERDLGAAEPDIGVHDVGVAVQPLAFALALAVEQLQALDCPHGLDEGRVLLGLRPGSSLRCAAKNAVEREPDACVEHEAASTTRASWGCRRRSSPAWHGHDAVDHGRDHAFGEKVADRLKRGEARQHVADVPLLEIGRSAAGSGGGTGGRRAGSAGRSARPAGPESGGQWWRSRSPSAGRSRAPAPAAGRRRPARSPRRP